MNNDSIVDFSVADCVVDAEVNENREDVENNVFFEESSEKDCVVVENNNVKIGLTEKLCEWSIKNNISSSAFNELLQVLNDCNINVPKDARTVKKTPVIVERKSVAGGVYVHYGLESALTDVLVVNDLEGDDLILDFNVDGLPLFKSSGKQVWPILGSIMDSSEVFMVGVFEGNSKPKCANIFLEEFISELNQLKDNGMMFANKKYNIKVRCFIMDAPARSFVLGTKGHSGYYSCVRCNIKGQIVNKHSLVFPPTGEFILRNNDSFRRRSQPEHHNVMTITALEKIIDFDIVIQISLDYMHIVCLGVMKTLLKAWVKKKGKTFL